MTPIKARMGKIKHLRRRADARCTGEDASDVKDGRPADIDACAALIRVASNC